MTTAVVIRTLDPARAAEALRAAVGLTLRGAQVVVVATVPLPEDSRALGTLRALGYRVETDPAVISGADAVEVWT